MTWNLWWRFGDWEARQEGIRSSLQDVSPDVCALQEVFSDGDTNQAERLASELGLYCAWGPTAYPEFWRWLIEDSSLDFGVAVLSRWPILESQVIDLAGEEGKPALCAIIDGPAGPFPFISAHLSAGAKRSAHRIEQVERLKGLLLERESETYPGILAGDFNAHPDSDEMRLASGLSPSSVDLALVDAWRFADPHDPGFTFDRANPHVADGPDPSSRFDYIYVGLRYHLDVGRVQSVRLAATEPVNGVWASDHAAVVAEVTH
jgi:endonuclease/exonuclease/phosphatase family metal-dependent hydrolase